MVTTRPLLMPGAVSPLTRDFPHTIVVGWCVGSVTAAQDAGGGGARGRCRACGNKEGARKYPAATPTLQKRKTQRVDLPRGPRRRKGAQRLGPERDAKI